MSCCIEPIQRNKHIIFKNFARHKTKYMNKKFAKSLVKFSKVKVKRNKSYIFPYY